MTEYMPSDKKYDGQLIEEYSRMRRIRDIALKEGSSETVKAIDTEISYIKLKLQPLVLPEDNE